MNDLLRLLRRHWWLALLLLLMLLVLPELAGAETPTSSQPVLPAASAPSAASIAAPAFSEFQQMLERPLFSSTRRPPVLDDAQPDNLDAQQLREVWRLSGIALEQGRQLALFSERQGERRLLLEVGMVLADDWRLERIGSDRVLFSNASGQVEMPLREPIIPPEPSAAPAAKEPAGSPAPAPTAAPSDKNSNTDKNPGPAGKPAAAAPAKPAPAKQG